MIKKLQTKIRRLRDLVRDARRYRWLRQRFVDTDVITATGDNPTSLGGTYVISQRIGGSYAELDRQIDHFSRLYPRDEK